MNASPRHRAWGVVLSSKSPSVTNRGSVSAFCSTLIRTTSLFLPVRDLGRPVVRARWRQAGRADRDALTQVVTDGEHDAAPDLFLAPRAGGGNVVELRRRSHGPARQ